MKSFLRSKRKALRSSRTTGLAKVTFSTNIQSKHDVCVVSLHVVFAHFVARAHLVVLHVLNHHILITKLLDNDLSVLRVRMYAADIVVRDPYRIVAVLGVNHKIPRAYLVLIHYLGKNFLDGFVNKRLFTVESFLNERQLVLCVELAYPCYKDDEQQDD